jgi:regulator of cell morphogenesis and NO signaling
MQKCLCVILGSEVSGRPVHGQKHPELQQVRASFHGLVQELTTHMMKEEMVLFPYIVRMEEAVIQKEPVLLSPFGSVQHPVSMMEHEHDSAGNALRAMREASSGYTAPTEACISYQTLYKALADFEADLHQHIHLENNILFPRVSLVVKRCENRLLVDGAGFADSESRENRHLAL